MLHYRVFGTTSTEEPHCHEPTPVLPGSKGILYTRQTQVGLKWATASGRHTQLNGLTTSKHITIKQQAGRGCQSRYGKAYLYYHESTRLLTRGRFVNLVGQCHGADGGWSGRTHSMGLEKRRRTYNMRLLQLGSKAKCWRGILRTLRTTSIQCLHCHELTHVLLLFGWYLSSRTSER